MRFLGKFNCIKEGRRGIAFSNRYILLDGLVCGVTDPYSFFLRVVSRASKPDGILAQVTIWVARTKVQNYMREWWKNYVQFEHFC